MENLSDIFPDIWPIKRQVDIFWSGAIASCLSSNIYQFSHLHGKFDSNINSRKCSEILPSNGLNPWPDDKNGNYKLRKARKGSAVNLSFQTRWNIRKTIEHFLPHCLRKLFKPYNKKYVMTTCVQNSSVVNIAISLIYGTMNSLRCFVSSFYNRNNSKRIQYSLQLVIQQNESFPGHNKARNLLLATQQRLYSLLHSRRMGSTFVDINDDYATPK